jgi:hypothetical protein
MFDWKTTGAASSQRVPHADEHLDGERDLADGRPRGVAAEMSGA